MEDPDKIKRIEEKKDLLILSRELLINKADLRSKDRAMHHERRQKLKEQESSTTKERRGRQWNFPDEVVEETEEEKRLRIEKRQQQLIKESPEITDLKKQLKQAYIRKELGAQLEEKRLERHASKTSNKDAEKILMSKILEQEADSERALQEKEIMKKIQYRKVLQDQMINRYIEKQDNYKKTLKERAVLDDALRMILEEEQMHLRTQVEKREKCRREIEAFKKAKAIWTLREKETEEDEERKIADFIKAKDEAISKQQGLEKVQTIELQRKQSIAYDLLKMRQDTTTDDEDSRLLKCLQEMDDRENKKLRDQQMKEATDKKELKIACTRQIEDRLARIQIEREEDMDYVRMKLRELEEDKKYQQVEGEKKRRMKHELRLLLLREIEEKQFRLKLDRDEVITLRKLEEKDRKDKHQVIEDARLTILKKHTENLVGFMPPGSLRHSDLPHLSQGVRDYYTHHEQPPDQEHSTVQEQPPDQKHPTVQLQPSGKEHKHS